MLHLFHQKSLNVQGLSPISFFDNQILMNQIALITNCFSAIQAILDKTFHRLFYIWYSSILTDIEFPNLIIAGLINYIRLFLLFRKFLINRKMVLAPLFLNYHFTIYIYLRIWLNRKENWVQLLQLNM